ncbi:zinc-binding dehydrogenase [Paenibacillus solani]|uniref:Alcohol dehydrogenase n=1 Tax=Paenibacillus solani TaxID=1705565 RepID=A0A0M1P4V4_9BACL|nr:zinc-binding dehydrogenase [Paenibacillus solani]KOR89516.1 alcohol dehydrogenase [Paenibacillus solani]
MKAAIHHGRSGLDGLRVGDMISEQPGPGEIRVRLKTAGLNHRDLFIMKGRSSSDGPLIPGSDGAGIIDAVGEGVNGWDVGASVIIHPTIGWDKIEEVPTVPQILGGPTNGTFAENVIIPAENAFSKPENLSWEEAGVLPLSALTAYRALFTRAKLKAGEHVLIPGIGGGVATYAMLMAQAVGAVVSVTSRNETKLEQARRFSVQHAVLSGGDWNEELKGEKVDVILDSIGPATFSKYLEVIKPNGRIVSFGASSGDAVEVPLRALFYPQLSWIGTSMGSREEFGDMLRFMEEHAIRPLIDQMYPLDETVEAFRRMRAGEQFGNIGLDLTSLSR